LPRLLLQQKRQRLQHLLLLLLLLLLLSCCRFDRRGDLSQLTHTRLPLHDCLVLYLLLLLLLLLYCLCKYCPLLLYRLVEDFRGAAGPDWVVVVGRCRFARLVLLLLLLLLHTCCCLESSRRIWHQLVCITCNCWRQQGGVGEVLSTQSGAALCQCV
jgi:hypothetical protein